MGLLVEKRDFGPNLSVGGRYALRVSFWLLEKIIAGWDLRVGVIVSEWPAIRILPQITPDTASCDRSKVRSSGLSSDFQYDINELRLIRENPHRCAPSDAGNSVRFAIACFSSGSGKDTSGVEYSDGSRIHALDNMVRPG